MGKNGGARPGAGRKPKAQKYEQQINKAERQVADWLPALMHNMKRLADGVVVQEETPDGETLIYQKPPDRAANQYLIDRIMGKPTERHELTDKDGAPLFKVYERSDDFDPDAA